MRFWMKPPARRWPAAGVFLLAILAACGPAGGPPPHYAALRDSLAARLSGLPGQVGVALVDLETDSTVSLSADVSMHAASTMKVPVLLELFRQSAAGRFRLEDSVAVRDTFTSIADGSPFSLTPDEDSEKPLYDLVGGRTTLLDLASRMIDRSSNLATDNLIELVTADSVQRLMRGLGTTGMVVLRGVEDIPAFDRGMNNTTTARALAGVLAALARCERGSVTAALRPLGPDDCRAMTDILARQEFNERIPAALPPGTRVAHKTGWITEIDHDAGIVYPPDRAPYVLAVLTHGFSDTSRSEKTIRDVSGLVWRILVGR
jgi:beta-lactamase class A